MDSRILLTGASGFLGRAVARKLGQSGQKFVAIDRKSSLIDDQEILECDVQDMHKLQSLATQYRFDGIIHCAAYSGPMLGLNTPRSVIETNVGGTANLLELARIRSIRRFIFCSSVSAVGPTTKSSDENVPLHPSTIYGATKAASESLISSYKHRFNLETVSLRLSAVWGPERETYCALGSIIKNAIAGQEVAVEIPGDFPTQYLHVEDAADALLLALRTKTLKQDAYNINGGDIRTFREVVDLVRHVLPETRVATGQSGDDLYEWQEPFLIDAARRDLGFTPRISLIEGIRDFVETLSPKDVSKLSS